MQLFMHDHIESVEVLSGGMVRVVAVLPSEAFEEIKFLSETLIHVTRWLNTRSRCSAAMSASRKLYITNGDLRNVA